LVHEDFTPNQIGVLGIFTAFAFSVANVYLAEKWVSQKEPTP
jgi:hypothetical protein